jgi:hypothetical protein
MRLLTVFALTAALLAAHVAPARAQGFITPFVGFNGGGDSNCASLTNCEDKRLDLGVSLGKTSGLFGFEEDFAYSSQFFGKTPGADNAVLTVMSNLLLVLPAGPIQPYALVGLGLIRPHVQLTSSVINQNVLGYDIGGGINIFLLHSVGLRGDVRHFQTLEGVTLGLLGSDKVGFWRGSAGITFRF